MIINNSTNKLNTETVTEIVTANFSRLYSSKTASITVDCPVGYLDMIMDAMPTGEAIVNVTFRYRNMGRLD